MSDPKPLLSKFVHLHVHSMYSLLNAVPTPKELAYAAKSDEQDALALTDAGALYGIIDFYKACQKEDIKPIIGLDAFLAPRTRHDKETGIDKPRARLVLLAKNFTGYQNLIKLTTRSNLEGFYYRPRLDEELLKEYSEGLICLIPSFAGEVSLAFKDHQPEKAEERLDWYRSVYGDDCYLEITRHPEILDHDARQEKIVTLGKTTNTPLVAAHDVYYLEPEDRVTRETMIKIQTGGVVDLSDDHGSEENFSFLSQSEMIEKFKDLPEAITNTVKIAESCNVEIVIGQDAWVFPDYLIDSGRSPDDELQITAYEGVAWRNLSLDNPEVKARLDYELDIIKTKGYAKYFLVVGDLLNEARKRGILTTIRGSVAGSLTTYVLGITNVDPLEYRLPFERFLNPERPSAPDIDMDFADNRRDEIIEYAKQKYGEDKVAQIGTFGTMMARAAVRDVARALGHPYSVGDQIAKLIPMGSQGFPMTIEHALEIEPDLAKLYKQDSEAREVINLAQKIEGRVRHLGVHAAGVVISPVPLNEIVPIQPDPKTGKYVTQYEMKSVGEDGVGLLKFDFLGIKNLAILADAVKRVKKIRNINIDIENIPLDDPKTFEVLARGETMGLFQLNGSGMTAFLKQLKPTTIHDINAMVALYRPGPMESIPQYIERKHNAHLVSYLDPRLEKILDRSYGVITYQDDVMTIARVLAGYSWLEADMLRKAMGKKIPEVMAAEKDKLLKGFVEYGKLSPNLAEKLWKLIEPFAAYGFNKCLPASVRVLNAENGVPTTIDTLLKRNKKPLVVALGANNKIVTKTATRPFENGVKTIYELTTRSGRVIRATGNHPLRTWGGWVNLSDLKIGDRLAVPRTLPSPLRTKSLPKHQSATLGYLLSEGNLCHPHGVYFYSTKDNELRDFIKSVRPFGGIVTINRSKSAVSVYVGGKPNKLMLWLKEIGLHKKRAIDKFVPDLIFNANNEDIAVFLGKLWQGDGSVSLKNQQTFYATSSRQLADDVQHLLLRLDILSTIHNKTFKYRGEIHLGWTIVVSGSENLQAFAKTAGKHLIGNKRVEFRELVNNSKIRTNNLGRGTADTVPAEVLSLIRSVMQERGHTPRTLAQMTGLSERLFSRDSRKRGYTRNIIKKTGEALQSSDVIAHATSDIFWDEVKNIVRDGREMTYDLSVPGPENFIANNFFVHNSHAASYGRVAYQTAYMKANFPVEYMSAVLTADSGDTDKIYEIIHECERMGIQVLPPDINESFADFSVVPGTQTIRFGLTTIKNFGAGISETIVEERKANGKYADMEDFLKRIHDRNLNKKSLESLIMAGAFDRFGERGMLLANAETMLGFHREHQNQKESAQDSLFGGLSSSGSELTLAPSAAALMTQKLIWEKDLLGVYVSGHPLDDYAEEVAKRPRIGSILKAVEDKDEMTVLSLKGQLITVGMISAIRELITKKGDKMAFVTLSDQTHQIEMVAFPTLYAEQKDLFTVGTCVAVKGKLTIRNDEPSIAIDRIKSLGPVVE